MVSRVLFIVRCSAEMKSSSLRIDETKYTDYGSLVGAMSGLTGVVSVNSQYGRKDKPIREKTNGEKFARFIGLDDDASTFSDNTGMTLSTMFTAGTGRTGVTNATGMTSASGAAFQRERSGMSKVSFKTQATRGSRQSQRSQRSRRSEQQPPRPPAALATSMPKTTTVSFEEPAMDFDEPSYSTRRAAQDGSTFTPRFIPQENADKVARAAAALMIDNKSTFSANSWDTMTTANRSVGTLDTKKSHVELVGRKEQGVVHKAMLNPPNVSTAILEEQSYDEEKPGSDFNRSHPQDAASDNATADDKSTCSGGSSKDSKKSKTSVTSNETTAIVMNRSPPVASNQLQRSWPSIKSRASSKASSRGSSTKEPSVKGFWSGVKSTQQMVSAKGKIPCIDEMSYGSEDIREWRDEREHFGLDTNTGSWTDGDASLCADTGTNYTGTVGDEDTAYTGYTGYTGGTGCTDGSMTDYSAQLSVLAKRVSGNSVIRGRSSATDGDNNLSARGRLVKGIRKK